MKTIVLVDMDGVIADFDGRFIEVWKTKHPERPQLDQNNRTNFRIEHEFPEQLRKEVRKVFTSPGFYRSLPAIPGAVDSMNEMSDSGFDVWICTSPLADYENCVLEKYKWVEDHLGRSWTEKIIITRNKYLIVGDWLIDDYPYESPEQQSSWKQILFDAPYNMEVENLLRMDSWKNWRQIPFRQFS